jgi:hypothetical protein
MKFLMVAITLIAGMVFGSGAEAQVAKLAFRKQVHFAVAGCAAANGGDSYAAPKCFGDVDVMAIPAGVVIERVYAIIDTAIAGTTDFDIGDDDSANGFLDGSLSLTIGTAGMYGWNAKTAGSYLRVQTAGVTDAADIYVVPNAKYYSASGKEVKMDATGAATGASQARIIVEGFYVGPKVP